jgi:hypothetical protein
VAYIDGTNVGTVSSWLPGTNQMMKIMTGFKTLDAVAKSNRLEYIIIRQDR